MTIAQTPEDRHFTASMVVTDWHQERVLLVHHKKMDLWVFPGGHVDPNEAPHETAVREVREETGIDVLFPLRGGQGMPLPIEVFEYPAPAWGASADGEWPAEPAHHHIDFLYLGHVQPGQDRIVHQQDEVHGARWAGLRDIGALNVREDVPRIARRYIA